MDTLCQIQSDSIFELSNGIKSWLHTFIVLIKTEKGHKTNSKSIEHNEVEIDSVVQKINCYYHEKFHIFDVRRKTMNQEDFSFYC